MSNYEKLLNESANDFEILKEVVQISVIERRADVSNGILKRFHERKTTGMDKKKIINVRNQLLQIKKMIEKSILNYDNLIDFYQIEDNSKPLNNN